MAKLSTAPNGFTGYIKYISMMPSGMQQIILGKAKSKRSSADRKFYIENHGVRQLYGVIGRKNIATTKIRVYTGKQGWDSNMIVRFNLVR